MRFLKKFYFQVKGKVYKFIQFKKLLYAKNLKRLEIALKFRDESYELPISYFCFCPINRGM